ncbi:MAG: hypothetical protein SFW67_00185 [Myxococcaceae bacterium]|nr:hypothetical protein [Myxococcaceae bacterium]
MLRLLVSALLLSCLSGCCTSAGCEDRVTWALPTSFMGLATTDTVRVRACFDTTCFDGPLVAESDGRIWSSADGKVLLVLPSQLSLALGSLERTRAGQATLELTRNGRAIITDTRAVTLSDTGQPNGPLCPPTCFSTRVQL